MSGLTYLGIMIGQILGMIYAVFDTIRYKRVADRSPGGRAPPEAWLSPSVSIISSRLHRTKLENSKSTYVVWRN